MGRHGRTFSDGSLAPPGSSARRSRSSHRRQAFISLALNFLGKRGQPNSLAPGRGFPPRERLHLQ